MDQAHRIPNPQGSAQDATPTEEQVLIAELLGGVAWRAVVHEVIEPRVNDIRAKLLLDATLGELERNNLQAVLVEYRALLERLYKHTEAGEVPGPLQKIFT